MNASRLPKIEFLWQEDCAYIAFYVDEAQVSKTCRTASIRFILHQPPAVSGIILHQAGNEQVSPCTSLAKALAPFTGPYLVSYRPCQGSKEKIYQIDSPCLGDEVVVPQPFL